MARRMPVDMLLKSGKGGIDVFPVAFLDKQVVPCPGHWRLLQHKLTGFIAVAGEIPKVASDTFNGH
jgi:hypothetical protein